MSFILVEIKTDHDNAEEAVRSVRNAMERAGYIVKDSYSDDRPTNYDLGTTFCDGRVEVQEPEVEDSVPNTQEENIAFRKEWDASVVES